MKLKEGEKGTYWCLPNCNKEMRAVCKQNVSITPEPAF